MNKIIDKLKNMPFVIGLRENTDKINKHLTVEVSRNLIQKKNSIDKLYDLLNSQAFFEWTIEMTD